MNSEALFIQAAGEHMADILAKWSPYGSAHHPNVIGKRGAVDFHFVPQHQEAMHIRLLNWARAQHNRSGSDTAPMFRQYRSSDTWAAPSVSNPVDQRDAAKINKGWQQLPEKHRASLQWHYVKPGSPTKACKAIGCTMDGLAGLVVDARTMLINRRV